MRPSAQGLFRYPLTSILGREANVRILRCLLSHGGALSAAHLALRSGLTKATVNTCLRHLDALQVTESLGDGQSVLHAVRESHPLVGVISALFAAEAERMTSILGTIKDAVGPDDGILALWIYGSAARGDDTADSDLDIAIIAKKAMPTVSSEEMHAKITQAGERLAFRPSILELTAADVLRLAEENDPWWVSVSRDALVIKGLRPADLVKAVRRKGVAAA